MTEDKIIIDALKCDNIETRNLFYEILITRPHKFSKEESDLLISILRERMENVKFENTSEYLKMSNACDAIRKSSCP